VPKLIVEYCLPLRSESTDIVPVARMSLRRNGCALLWTVALSHGFRVQKSEADAQGESSDAMKTLSAMLLAFEPTSAFHPSISRMATRPRPGVVSGRQSPVLKMQEEDDEPVILGKKPKKKDEGPKEPVVGPTPEVAAQDPIMYPARLDFLRGGYFPTVEVGLGEEVSALEMKFPGPSFASENSALSTVYVVFPIGCSIEESIEVQGRYEIVGVQEGSNAEKAGIKNGDLLRGMTAMAKAMKRGGEEQVAQPALFFLDDRDMNSVAEAWFSNSKQRGGVGAVTFVIERENPFGDGKN